MKIAPKIISAASIVIALTLLAAAIVQYVHNRDETYAKTEHAVQTTLVSLSGSIQNWLNSKQAIINTLIETADIQPDRDAAKAVLERPLLSQEFISVYSGLEETGKLYSNTSDWIPEDSWDARTRPWYTLAKDKTQAVITDPYVDSEFDFMLISVSARLTEHGKFFGVIAGDVGLKVVSEMINKLNFGNGSYVFLFNRSGLIISHPDEKLNGKTLKDLFSQQTLDLSHTGKFQDNIINNNAVKVMLMPIEGLPVTQQWILGMVQDTSEFDAQAQQLGIRAFIATMLSVALCTLILMIVIGKLMQPLVTLRNSLRTIRQDGDLTHRLSVTTKDEIADLSNDFNVFLEYLQRAMHHIKDHAHNIRGNSENMAHSSAQTSQRIDVQVSEIDNLNTAMSEMVLAAESVANNAQLTADAVVSAESQAQAGLEMMGGVNNTITTLSEDMQQAVVAIDELSQVSDNIGSIVTAISSISDQTNLLALNASIEAARAGEAGRGFAVVADEVRSLASKTQQSTEEIDRMIRQLQQRITDAHNAIQNSQNRTEEARNIVMQADQALANIRNNISDINAMTSGTAAAVEQQSATTHAINDNTRNLRDISYQLHESIQEQTDLTQKNANLTHDQDQVLSRFKV